MKYKSLKLTHLDGKMHHLGIDENDVVKNVLLVQTPDDVKAAANLLDKAEYKGMWREYLTYTGEMNGIPITVMSSGMGCMPMAITVEELKHLGVKNIIKIGTGAAIQPQVKPGTLFISSSAVRGEGATLEYINYQYPAVADIGAINALVQAAKEYKEKPVVGMFRSHDAVYKENSTTRDKIAYWSDLKIDIIDSETSALLTIAALLRDMSVASLYVASENYMDKSKLNNEELDDRLKQCTKIAIKALQLMD